LPASATFARVEGFSSRRIGNGYLDTSAGGLWTPGLMSH
jgi:hypothetical protein